MQTARGRLGGEQAGRRMRAAPLWEVGAPYMLSTQ